MAGGRRCDAWSTTRCEPLRRCVSDRCEGAGGFGRGRTLLERMQQHNRGRHDLPTLDQLLGEEAKGSDRSPKTSLRKDASRSGPAYGRRRHTSNSRASLRPVLGPGATDLGAFSFLPERSNLSGAPVAAVPLRRGPEVLRFLIGPSPPRAQSHICFMIGLHRVMVGASCRSFQLAGAPIPRMSARSRG
jgi:hypothetical protein